MRLPLLDALAIGAERWDELALSSPRPSPFMRWAWHRAWSETAPPDERESASVIATHGPDGRLQALLPFRLERLRFRRAPATVLVWAVGDLGAPDHLDLPCASDGTLENAASLVEELPWDVMALRHVADEPTAVSRLAESLSRRGMVVRRKPLDACPYLDLPGDWDAYLASLSPARRYTIRRKERALGRKYTVTISDYAPDRLDEGWSRLRELHTRRFGSADVFADDRVDRLLRTFNADVAPSGDIWLTTLDLDGQPAAAWYGFAWNDTVYFYQGGRDPRWDADSVGLVLGAVMLRRAIERGYRRFDFLRGREAYKYSWTSTEQLNHEVTIFRRNWRGTMLLGLDTLGRARGYSIPTPVEVEVPGK